jgi:hypothetical protein
VVGSTAAGTQTDRAVILRTVRAFNKLLWLQNDLISRHYLQTWPRETYGAPSSR